MKALALADSKMGYVCNWKLYTGKIQQEVSHLESELDWITGWP